MFHRDSGKLFKAVDAEVKAMKQETEEMEAMMKQSYFEQRGMFKNISMKDYLNVMNLEENQDELKDFDFMPRDRMQFVKILDKEPFVRKQ